MQTENKALSDQIRTLVHNGLNRSCSTLSFFLKEEVELEILSFSDVPQNPINTDTTSEGKEIILYSDIIGQIQGRSFFKLDRNEANLLFSKNIALPEGTTPDKGLFEGFLLELDNIITAAVITEFANSLQIKAYGGVPHIFYLNPDTRNELKQMEDASVYKINFVCRYKMNNMIFSPVFLWLLKKEFEQFVDAGVVHDRN